MNIDEARRYLVDIFKPEYTSYINTQLAGDFAVVVAKKLQDNSYNSIVPMLKSQPNINVIVVDKESDMPKDVIDSELPPPT